MVEIRVENFNIKVGKTFQEFDKVQQLVGIWNKLKTFTQNIEI